MTLPNLITVTRIVLIPLFLILLLTLKPWLAVGLFIILALSDAVDGFLARCLKQTSELGKFLDPLADKILVLSGLIGLVELQVIGAVPVIIILARELAVMGLRISAAQTGSSAEVPTKVGTKAGTVIAASYGAKWKTVSQMVAVPWLILNLPYGIWILWLAVLLSVISGIEYFIKWPNQLK